MEVFAEGGLLSIQGDGAVVGDMTRSYECLQISDIAEERASVGGWHICHKLGDCGG